MEKILLILFYFGFPILVIKLTQKSKLADRIGAVVICYAVGLIVGNVGLISTDLTNLQNTISEITIAVAIPLILFSANLKKWLKLINKTIVSLLLGLLAVIVVTYIGFFYFNGKIDDAWKLSGMLVAVYSGGTPNMAALQTALEVSQETYILANTSDLIISAFVLLFLISVGQKTFELFLPKFSFAEPGKNKISKEEIDAFNDFNNFFTKNNIKNWVTGLVLSALIVGSSLLLSKLFGSIASIILIVAITTFGIVASFSPKIRNLHKTFPLGLYFMYVFCLVIASLADFSSFWKIESLNIFLYISFVVLGSLILHAILSKFFKVDADTLIITTIALLMSVPFIPVVASALKNKQIIISGVIVALIGYAIGNYLGIIVALSLEQFSV